MKLGSVSLGSLVGNTSDENEANQPVIRPQESIGSDSEIMIKNHNSFDNNSNNTIINWQTHNTFIVIIITIINMTDYSENI